MLNFPIPYPEEVLYSTVARTGIWHGLVSPKQLLDEVFGTRGVIATVDLPNHLSTLSRWLPDAYTPEQLLYAHTLFPLYAPFVSEERRQRCMKQMIGNTQSAVHLALGVAASRVKVPRSIRYCSGCLADQQANQGEYFWQREWQVAGVDECPAHGTLTEAPIRRPAVQRHRFIAASPDICRPVEQHHRHASSICVCQQVRQLLRLPDQKSPTSHQWTAYYRHLAARLDFCRGQTQADHQRIREAVMAAWPASWLAQFDLVPDDPAISGSGWLMAMFRKHRKSFSYLQHIVVNQALLGTNWSICEVIAAVRRFPRYQSRRSVSGQATDSHEIDRDQQKWAALLLNHSPKQARNADAALYARLYRKYHAWLLETNHQHEAGRGKHRMPRVDWANRDKAYLQKLKHIGHILRSDVNSPRRSQSCYLQRLGCQATLEKNLQRLPLSAAFLSHNAESVSQYQIRRLSRTYDKLRQQYMLPPRWRLLRDARLSEERLQKPAKEYLDKLAGVS